MRNIHIDGEISLNDVDYMQINHEKRSILFKFVHNGEVTIYNANIKKFEEEMEYIFNKKY